LGGGCVQDQSRKKARKKNAQSSGRTTLTEALNRPQVKGRQLGGLKTKIINSAKPFENGGSRGNQKKAQSTSRRTRFVGNQPTPGGM